MKNNNIFIVPIVVWPWKITRSWVIRNVWYVELRPVTQFITLCPNQALTTRDPDGQDHLARNGGKPLVISQQGGSQSNSPQGILPKTTRWLGGGSCPSEPSNETTDPEATPLLQWETPSWSLQVSHAQTAKPSPRNCDLINVCHF